MDDDEAIFGKWSDNESKPIKPPMPKQAGKQPPKQTGKRPAKPRIRKQPESSDSEDEELQQQIAAVKSASKIYAQASKKAKTAAYDRAAQEYYSAQFWQNEKQLSELQKKKRK